MALSGVAVMQAADGDEVNSTNVRADKHPRLSRTATMSNEITSYPDIEFTREAVSKRIKETKEIISKLSLLEKHPDNEHRLYVNEQTGAYWQYASAWNWGAKPYCFIVPKIEIADWRQERYVDPDELMLYVIQMRQFLAAPSNKSIPNLAEHVAMLQRMRTFPENPKGRWFGPYKSENVIPNLG